MAAEIILDPARGIQEQMQEILALAGSGEHGEPDRDVPAVNWYPRPDKPHGGVVRVPNHIAEAHSARMAELRAADEAAQDETGDEVADDTSGEPVPDDPGTEEPAPGSSRRSRRGKAATDTATDTGDDSGGNA